MYLMEEEHPSLLLPVSLSCIVHVLIVIIALLLPAHMPKEPKETVIEVWPSSPEQIETRMAAKPRIADIDKPAVQKRPKKAKFVGLYDSSVEEETVARKQGKGGGAAGGKKRAARKGTKGKKGTAKKRKSATKGKKEILDFDKDMFAMREPSTTKRPMPSQGRQTEVGRVAIGGGGGDYFPDIKRGQHTYLNVLRYPGVGYFVRLKRAFRTTFNPAPSLRSYFSMNQVASGSVNVVMAVSVNGSGNLAELFVLRSSGIPAYDQEAMRTVRASSPFATPPAKFLTDDGVLRMMWTFTVYL